MRQTPQPGQYDGGWRNVVYSLLPRLSVPGHQLHASQVKNMQHRKGLAAGESLSVGNGE